MGILWGKREERKVYANKTIAPVLRQYGDCAGDLQLVDISLGYAGKLASLPTRNNPGYLHLETFAARLPIRAIADCARDTIGG